MKTCVVILCVVAFVALAAFPREAAGLKCYICNSVEHKEGCGHGKDVDDQYLKDCNEQPAEGGVSGSNYQFCRKIVTIIDFDVNNNTATERITRRCGYKNSTYDTTCYYRAGFGGRQTVCSCMEDNCNSGFTFGINSALMSFVVGAAVLMKYAH